jgi:uncharacterized protein (DUF4415 family)
MCDRSACEKRIYEKDDIMRYTQEPDPHKPLTDAEWQALGPVMQGVSALPPEAREAVLNAQRKGRPPVAKPKRSVSIRLDEEVLIGFKAYGKGWQTQMNAALKAWISQHPAP